MMDPFQNNMATQFGRFRILFRKSFIENVYANILKNIFFYNSFYLIIFLKHLRCFFTNAYGVRICSACGGNSRRHFGRTMCLHTKDTSTGQPTAGRSKLPSAAGVFRKKQKAKKVKSDNSENSAKAKTYNCSECTNSYASISGLRGHLRKKTWNYKCKR